MLRRLAFAIITVFATLALSAVPALAKNSGNGGHGGGGGGGGTATPLGNDISWPQCGGSYPSGQAFGVVGVNDGLANNFNPCFSNEFSWAQSSGGGTSQDKAQLYVNTGNPGDVLYQYNVSDWPSSGNTPYGDCVGTYTDDRACSWEYGYQRALADVNQTGLNGYRIWLDVETGNSWTNDTAKNRAALEGMVYYFSNFGNTVGLYSTGYQWGKIAGTPDSQSNLNGLDSWLPGARRLSSAESNCKQSSLTAGGKVILTQFVSGGYDYDYSCK